MPYCIVAKKSPSEIGVGETTLSTPIEASIVVVVVVVGTPVDSISV